MTALKASVLVPVVAATLFVSPEGRDSWPGTEDRPFATPERAQQAVRARTAGMTGDIVVNLRGGTYRLRRPLRFSSGDSGQNGHRVIYRAYGSERVVISGGRRVTGWRRVGGAWRADVGDLETRQLFVDGRRATRTALGHGLPKAIRVRTGYAIRSTVPQSWRRPADMELVFNGRKAGLGYSEARCGVARVRGDAKWSLIDLDQPCWRNLNKAYDAEFEGLRPGAPTDVENSLSLLRRPGSWYLDRSRRGRHVLYYLPRRGEDPRRVPVVAPVLQRLLVGSALHDVTFSGLTFSPATWLAPSRPAGFPQIIGSWFRSGRKAFDRMPGHVAFRGGERITIEGNRFSQLGGLALVLSSAGASNTVHGNVVADVSGGSIEVNDVPYTGIWGASPGGLRVESNLVYDAVQAVPDGGGIYLPAAHGTSFDDGAVVRGNVVHDAGGTGIYPDVGADWVTVERNVLYGSDEAVSGVEPKRIRITDNHWDDDSPFWWPEDTPTDGITLADNLLLPRNDPEASCRADAACTGILNSAGR